VIVSGADVRLAAERTLQQHLPGVLEQLALQWDAQLPAPKPAAYQRLNDFVQMTQAQSPGVIVTSSGVESSPVRDEVDSYRPAWLIRVFIVIRGRTYEETADRVTHYCAAVRTVFARDGSLGGLCDQAVWRDEKYTELDRTRERTVAAGSVAYAFTTPTDSGPTSTPVTGTFLTTAPLPIHPALEGPP
jgi:hypothetical protein